MRWVVCFIVFIGLLAVMSGNVSAMSWGEDLVLTSKAPEEYSNNLTFVCGAEVKVVRVSREPNMIRACVYGEQGGVRVARYPGSYGDYLLAIAYPSDIEFHTVEDLCNENSPCVYSQVSDTLYTTTGGGVHNAGLLAYSSLSKQLRRHSSRIGPYFTPTAHFKPAYQEAGFPVRSLAVSQTGRWIVVEHPGKGIVRMDTITGERRRIHTTHYDDSRGRFAISSDGSAIAAAGEGRNLEIINIDTVCGDDVREGLGSQFPQHVRQCRVVHPDIHRDIPGAIIVSHPAFYSVDRLYIQVYTRTGITGGIYTTKASDGIYSYVALGDSFTSGEGEMDNSRYFSYTDEGHHGCHVSNRSYPYLLAQVPLMETVGVSSVYSAACSGATTVDIIGSGSYAGQGDRLLKDAANVRSNLLQRASVDGLRGIIPQVDFIKKHQPQYVTIGIGGNDVGFSGKLKSCLGVGVCEWAKPGGERAAVAREIDSLEGKLTDMMESVVRASSAKVYLIGYPQLIRESQEAMCDPLLGRLLKPVERLFISKSITRINQVIRRVAQTVNAHYLDIEDVYGSHRLCDDTKTPAMNGIRAGDDIVIAGMKIIGAESFHPTPYGHERVSNRIVELMGVQQPSFRQAVQSQDGYWSEGVEAGDEYRYILNSSTERRVASGEREYKMTIAPGIFEPFSRVEVGVQGSGSVPFTTQADGGLTAGVSLLHHIDQGAIVVQATGYTVTGEKVILYEIVTVVPAGSLDSTREDKHRQSISTDPLSASVGSGVQGVVSSVKVPAISAAPSVTIMSNLERSESKREARTNPLLSYWWVGVALLVAASLTLLLYRRYNK